MRVLITGGSGQVGTALRESAPADVLIRAPSSGELDIRSRASVDAALAAWQPDLAVNAAAYTQVERAEEEVELAMEVNGAGAGNLAAACAESRCRLIHLSTDYVFDGTQNRAYLDDDTPAPLNVYGHSKLEGERAVQENLDELCDPADLLQRDGIELRLLSLAGRDEVPRSAGTPCGFHSCSDVSQRRRQPG